MQPQDTPWAHRTSPSSVFGAANRVSSTTLSIPSSPEPSASAILGNEPRARAAAIHRAAFQ